LQLTELFESLPVPEADTALPSFATSVLGSGPHRLGKDSQGSPVLLITARPELEHHRPPPIELEHLVVQHRVQCRLWHAAVRSEEAVFTIVACRQADQALRDYFLRVLDGVVPLLGPSPTEDLVREVVDALAELFRSLMIPARKSVQGLWAELFLIVESRNAATVLAAWHSVPEERYDFSRGTQRIEVKSAPAGVRSHYFSLSQLTPPPGAAVVIASVFVERSGGGVSIAELVESVRTRAANDPQALFRLDKLLAANLGHNWRNALDERFDLELARASTAFYPAERIPSVGPAVPSEVTEVRFRSDISGVEPVTPSCLSDAGGLFQAAIPLRELQRG